jgi:hypothetical protein
VKQRKRAEIREDTKRHQDGRKEGTQSHALHSGPLAAATVAAQLSLNPFNFYNYLVFTYTRTIETNQDTSLTSSEAEHGNNWSKNIEFAGSMR